MKKEIYIHIGMHKTGSTYIQKKFSENREVLSGLNILYPRIGAEYLFGHHNVAWNWHPAKELQNAPDFSVDKLVDSLKQSPLTKLVLSSEAFVRLNTGQIAELREALREFTACIVMYIRHPCKAFYPYWQTYVKNGGTLSIHDFYTQTLNNPAKFDFHKIATSWASVFGSDAVKTVVYDNLLETGQDIASYFIENIVGVDPCKSFISTPTERVNQSLPMPAPEVIRCLHQLDENNQHDLGGKFRNLVCSGLLGVDFTQQLENIKRDGTELLDLGQLHEISSQIERTFLESEHSAMNPYSSQQLFKDLQAEDTRLSVAKPGYVEKNMDIKSLYLNLIS